METMFEHLDDNGGIDPGPEDLNRVLNRARDLRARRTRLVTVGLCVVLLVTSVAFFVAHTPTTPLSASAADYEFNAIAGALKEGVSVPSSALIDVDFVSPMNGFGLASHRGDVTLVETTDSGDQWTVRNGHLPAGLGAADGYPGQIEFVGFTGYLWGAQGSDGTEPLWVTHNDGATWQKAPIGPYVVDASAIGLNVWALTTTCAGPTGSSSACRMSVAESDDGGTTWNSLRIESPSQTPLDVGLQVPLELARITHNSAYVLSITSNIGMGTPPTREIAFTDNAGMSWTQRPVPCAGLFDAGAELAASGTNDLWLLCGSDASGGSQQKELYRSYDGGLQWIPTSAASIDAFPPTTTTFGSPTALLPLPGYIAPLTIGHRNLAVASPKTAWLFPSRAPLFKTSDGGSVWLPVGDIAAAGFASGGAGNITFISATQGWICEYGIGIWRTTDGIHWSELNP